MAFQQRNMPYYIKKESDKGETMIGLVVYKLRAKQCIAGSLKNCNATGRGWFFLVVAKNGQEKPQVKTQNMGGSFALLHEYNQI